MAVDFSSIDTTAPASSTAAITSSAPAAPSGSVTADTFLKLLVTQMQNQDPLNPMDNAQVTSQMAQINTVSGISTLNATVQGLNSQFLQLQSLTGAGLVGRDVWVAGNGLATDATTGVSKGAFNLAGAADAVKLEVLSPSGQVVDTQQLGADSAGRHSFEWSKSGVTDTTGYTFRITAASGAAAVSSTSLMLDHVDSIGLNGDTLTLALAKSGDVPYSQVLAVD